MDDEAIIDAMRLLAETEGIWAETAGGVTAGRRPEADRAGPDRPRRVDRPLHHRQRPEDPGAAARADAEARRHQAEPRGVRGPARDPLAGPGRQRRLTKRSTDGGPVPRRRRFDPTHRPLRRKAADAARSNRRLRSPAPLSRGIRPCPSSVSPPRSVPMPAASTASRPPAPRSARSWASSPRSIPALRERLFDGDELRRFVNVYVNNEDIRYLDDLATPGRRQATRSASSRPSRAAERHFFAGVTAGIISRTRSRNHE